MVETTLYPQTHHPKPGVPRPPLHTSPCYFRGFKVKRRSNENGTGMKMVPDTDLALTT